MIVEELENEILLRIPITENKKRIKEIIDFLLYESITTRTEVSQIIADKLISEVKNGRFKSLT